MRNLFRYFSRDSAQPRFLALAPVPLGHFLLGNIARTTNGKRA
jgi:hypothetical protein